MEESHNMEQASFGRRRNAAICGDTIQLVESELPISEATNYMELAGVFLFRQLCFPCWTSAMCLFCKQTYTLMRRGGLAKHYYVRHGLSVVHARARFDESIIFFHVPNDFDKHSPLSMPCTLCDTILRSGCDIFLHYFADHRKEARFLPEPKMSENYGNFNCSICETSFESFREHCDHSYFAHKRTIYFCKYCMFCTVNSDKFQSHMKCHIQRRNGLNFQCPACSVYLRGTYVLLRHLKKYHARPTGETEWCCRHCVFSFDFHNDLLYHLSFCPLSDSPFRLKQQQSSISEEHSMQQEIESLRGSLHISNTDERGAAVQNKGDGINECIIEGTATKSSKAKHPGEVSNCADGSGEASSMNLAKRVKDIQKEQTLEYVHRSSRNDSGIQIACGGCLMYFGSEDQFAEHYCTEKAM